MFTRFRFSYLVALVVIPSLLFSACSFSGNKEKGEQVLNLPITQEPPNLDPTTSTDAESAKVITHIYEGLYRLAENGKLVLGMAKEEPQISADKMTYTFTLRDAKWSDGQPVTAEQFVDGFLRVLNPKTASQYASFLFPLKNAEAYNKGTVKAEDVGIKAPDKKTVVLTLERPLPYFEELLTFTTCMPCRMDIIEKFGDKYSMEAGKMIGNGPFVLTKWEHNASVKLTKNENYWDKNTVKLKEINLLIVKDTATSLNFYKTNKIDMTPLDAEFVDAYKNNPEKIITEEAVCSYLEMNQQPDSPFGKLFGNINIRQSISEAIDRKALAGSVLRNGSIPAGGLVPPSIKAGGKKFRDEAGNSGLQCNPSEARKKWNKGLKELGIDNPGKIELLGTNDSLSKKILEYIQAQLKANLGLDVEIVALPFKERLDRGKKGRFQMIVSAWQGDYNDPMTMMDLFLTGKTWNHGRWSNQEYDALIKKSQKNSDFEQRTKDLVKAENILVSEDAAIVPLYFKSRTMLMKPSVRGVIFHTIGAEMSWKWAYIAQ